MSTPFNPYWLEPGAAVPVDIATTAALMTEIQRLRQALLAEREACAKVCEDKNTLLRWPTYAAAVRARGEK